VVPRVEQEEKVFGWRDISGIEIYDWTIEDPPAREFCAKVVRPVKSHYGKSEAPDSQAFSFPNLTWAFKS